MTKRADPIPWLERLLEVNASADFTSEQKIAIAAVLRGLIRQFGGAVASAR